MEEKAYEMFIKYIKAHSLMSKNAAKNCAYLELEGRVEELSKIPGTELRIRELEEMKTQIFDI